MPECQGRNVGSGSNSEVGGRYRDVRFTSESRLKSDIAACPRGVESRCGAVTLGRTYPLPPLSSGGALVVTPSLRFHIPLIGRVEDWRAGRLLDRATFPVPSTSHAACGFPALRAPICFTPKLMVQPSPRRIVSASGPANQWTPLSSRPCLPYVGDIANGRAPSLRGHYSASSLLRTQPPPSRLWPTSRFRRLYGLPCSDDFAPGRGGLLQLLSMSLSPCCRFHPAEVNIRIGQSSAAHAAKD